MSGIDVHVMFLWIPELAERVKQAVRNLFLLQATL
jgi:hypothetical protein